MKSLTLEARSGCESFINHSEAYSSEDLRKLGASHCQLEMLVQNWYIVKLSRGKLVNKYPLVYIVTQIAPYW